MSPSGWFEREVDRSPTWSVRIAFRIGNARSLETSISTPLAPPRAADEATLRMDVMEAVKVFSRTGMARLAAARGQEATDCCTEGAVWTGGGATVLPNRMLASEIAPLAVRSNANLTPLSLRRIASEPAKSPSEIRTVWRIGETSGVP